MAPIARLQHAANAPAIPEDVRRSIGAALFGVALAFMARERAKASPGGRRLFAASLIIAAAASAVTLLFEPRRVPNLEKVER
jgi:hypothetical protein